RADALTPGCYEDRIRINDTRWLVEENPPLLRRLLDFMTALQVILFKLMCPRDHRAKSIQFQLTCVLRRDSHKTPLWLCFLILSVLSTCSSAASMTEIKDLQTCLGSLRVSIEKSDAMLYSPSVNEVTDVCKEKVLQCYMLELLMILEEEDINDPEAPCIGHFSRDLKPEDGCPPCEIHSLEDSKKFYQNLETILQKITDENSI
ncbi:uncharacterized protein LOC108239486, partial [Kryptolebias marmoratus]